MATPHSAAPQALGYLFQARQALYLLLRESRPDATVAIERLDDVEINVGSKLTLEQLKHHITRTAVLTDSSSDIWKTLRIWATQLDEKIWDPSETALHLVTTATAPEGSAAWYLKDGEARDPERADALLISVAAKSKDKALAKSFAAYRKLSDDNRLLLLHAIRVLDQSPNILELGSLIRQQIRAAAPPDPGKLDRAYDALEGWWFQVVVEHLATGSGSPVAQITVYQKLWSITEELKRDNLPISFGRAVPNYVVNPLTDERMFVRQLRVLDIHTGRIKQAILDYYRAFEQRSSWITESLIVDDEVTEYEHCLVEAWSLLKLALEDELLSPAKLDAECIELGRRLVKWIETEANFPFRRDVVATFVMRGSFHMLANEDEPRVHWHPLFLDSLGKILTQSAV